MTVEHNADTLIHGTKDCTGVMIQTDVAASYEYAIDYNRGAMVGGREKKQPWR